MRTSPQDLLTELPKRGVEGEGVAEDERVVGGQLVVPAPRHGSPHYHGTVTHTQQWRFYSKHFRLVENIMENIIFAKIEHENKNLQ